MKSESRGPHDLRRWATQRPARPVLAYLRRLVNGGYFGPDAERNVFVLGIPSVQIPEMLVPGLPPEVKEAIGNRVVLKHDIVHVSVFLSSKQQADERTVGNNAFL